MPEMSIGLDNLADEPSRENQWQITSTLKLFFDRIGTKSVSPYILKCRPSERSPSSFDGAHYNRPKTCVKEKILFYQPFTAFDTNSLLEGMHPG